jgi:hypothetical protein
VQKEADIMHQQRQVQVQRTKEWMEMAQKTQVAMMRFQNLTFGEFNVDLYDTVLASAPPDPGLAQGRQLYQRDVEEQNATMTPAMLAKYQNGENYLFVDGGAGWVGAKNHESYRNLEGKHATMTFNALMMQNRTPYVRTFRCGPSRGAVERALKRFPS